MVDYNNFSKTFSDSRKNMKWQEISYFLEVINKNKAYNILDIWCGNGRLLWELKKSELNIESYLWVDLSKWLLEEARNIYPDDSFLELNMLDINKIKLDWSEVCYFSDINKCNLIFFIASFHHLDNLDDRLDVLKKAYYLLENGWEIYMTNWALNSELNRDKYQSSIVEWSKNKFWSLDYSIKIWEYTRYYHCFDISELEFLARESWFELLENKLFDNNRNFITVLKKA